MDMYRVNDLFYTRQVNVYDSRKIRKIQSDELTTSVFIVSFVLRHSLLVYLYKMQMFSIKK